MRKKYQQILKKFFRSKLLLKRGELNLTQEQISEKLQISLRNYSNLESGKSSCSTLTLILFLIFYCPDVNGFISELKSIFESDIENTNTENIWCQHHYYFRKKLVIFSHKLSKRGWTTLREYYQKILKEIFYKYLIKERTRLKLTQEKMANILEMDTRNFVNLDNGKNCCNALTLTLFLIYCTDPIEFLKELKYEYENNAYKEFAYNSATYRQKLPVKELSLYEKENSIYALCPRCRGIINRDYVKYCSCCGQRISWTNWSKAQIVNT